MARALLETHDPITNDWTINIKPQRRGYYVTVTRGLSTLPGGPTWTLGGAWRRGQRMVATLIRNEQHREARWQQHERTCEGVAKH